MTELTPEERQRIYEEEKARVEVHRPIKEAKKGDKSNSGCLTGILILMGLVLVAYIGRQIFYPLSSLIRSSDRVVPRIEEAPSYGKYTVERFWEDTTGDYTCAYTIVSYKNTTSRTFTSAVTIRATIYDAEGQVIDTNDRSFFAHEYGPIRPGFEGTVKIPIECRRGQAKSVKVRIESAQ